MAVSTSTIVFAVATCIPFGLAVRDTVQKRSPLDELRSSEAAIDAETEARRARMRAEQAAEDAEREVQHQHRQLMLVDLVGREVATLGSSFEGITIGMTAADLNDQRHVIDRLQDETGASIRCDADDTMLHGITVTPAQDTCDFVSLRLDRLWGAGHVAGGFTYWHTADGSVRASFESEPTGCVLRYDQAVTVDAWLDKKAGSVVPVALVGKSPKALIGDIMSRRTADRVDQGEVNVMWFDAGVGNGVGRTQLSAVIRGGKVAWIEARAEMDVATTDAVQARLTALYGKPTGDELLEWAARPRITLALGRGTNVVLTVGTLP